MVEAESCIAASLLLQVPLIPSGLPLLSQNFKPLCPAIFIFAASFNQFTYNEEYSVYAKTYCTGRKNG
jgi:hypothetical protein